MFGGSSEKSLEKFRYFALIKLGNPGNFFFTKSSALLLGIVYFFSNHTLEFCNFLLLFVCNSNRRKFCNILLLFPDWSYVNDFTVSSYALRNSDSPSLDSIEVSIVFDLSDKFLMYLFSDPLVECS